MMTTRRPVLAICTSWKHSNSEQPQSPGPRRVPSRLTREWVRVPVKKGLPHSPPRRVVHPFTPKTLGEFDPLYSQPQADVPFGGHPWFTYQPENMV